MRCFQAELCSRFLPSSCAGHVNRAGERLGSPGKIANMAALLKSLFFVFNISFLPKYCVKYYDYISGRVGYNVIGVYRWIFPKF